jgi:glycosyltransferase involved in cell wall biosynthesis
MAALYVGRVAPEKNLRVAVAAYRVMQRLSPSVKFVIVGDGPFRATLQREHPDLIFCGVQRGEALARHYASADVFLFPSETETFGNVTLEAMASGLVVVAYDYAAARMHITHGETGVLVPYGESPAFADAAASLAHAPQSLHKMRRRAQAYARALDWPHVVEKLETLLTGAPVQRHTAPEVLGIRRGVAI